MYIYYELWYAGELCVVMHPVGVYVVSGALWAIVLRPQMGAVSPQGLTQPLGTGHNKVIPNSGATQDPTNQIRRTS